MNIFDPHITGSLSVSASANIQGDLVVGGTIYGTAQITGQVQDAVSASHASSYLLTSSFETYTGSAATTGSNTFIGDQTISGSLLPQGTLTHDLGSDSQRWRDIYLAGNTINLGGTKITKDVDGNVEIKDGSNNLKKIVASEIEIGTGNSKKVLKVDNGRFKLMDSADSKDELAALSGSFTGSFVGDGSRLTNVPAGAVTGLNLARISNTTATASISNAGLITNVSILPDSTDTIDLGSPTKQWRDLYLSSGSLYINGQQVLSTTGTELRVTTDAGESIKILETGSDTITLQTENGDITLTSSGNGNIELDAPVQIGAGNKILSSDGNSIQFGNGLIITGSIVLTGNVDGVDVARLKSDVDAILAGSTADKDSFAEIVQLINSVDTTNDQAFAAHYTASNNRFNSIESTTSSFDGRLDSLETKTGSLDSVNTTQNSRLTALETKTGSLNSDISGLDGRLDSLETESGSIRGTFNSYTSSNNTINSTQNSRLSSLETTSGSHAGRLSSIESFTSSIDTTYATDADVTSLRGTLNTYTSSNDSKISSLETKSGSVDLTLGNIAFDITSLDGRLDSIESFTGSIDETYATDADVTSLRGTLNTYTSSNDGRNATQDGRLNSLESSRTSLNSFTSSAGGRLTSIESFTASIDTTYATDEDVTNLRTDLNTYTSSNNNTNNTQNSRLTSLETKTGSLNSDISSLDGRVDSLEVESGSIRSTFNTYTSSNDGRNATQDGRLNTLESFKTTISSYTASNDNTNSTQNSRLSSLETTSGSHNTRISGLETFESKVDGGLEFTGSNVTIKGDLLVKGTETRVDSTTVEISDNIISLNGSGAANAGIEVRDMTSPGLLSGSLLWDGANNYWVGGPKGSEERLLTNSDLTTLDGRLDSLETESGSVRSTLNTYTSSNDNRNATQDGRLNSIETKTGSLESVNNTQNNRLGSIETKTGSLESVNNTQNNRLSSLETFTGSIDSTYATDSDVTNLRNTLNTYTSSNDGRNGTQDGRLNSLESSRTSLNSFTSSASGRLSSIESFTSSIDDTYATDADVTSLRNTLNTYTSSNDGRNGTQDGRLNSLESSRTSLNSFTSSASGRLSSIETTTGSFDGRLDSIESFTGSLDATYATDSDVTSLRTTFNTYTGSNNSTNNTQNNRLSSLETKTGSLNNDISLLDGRLDSIESNTGSYLTQHPTISAAGSSNNSGRTYIQDILLDSNGHVTGLTTGTETVVNTDRYVTGATFNSSNADLTLTRNDGNSVTVRLLDTLTDVTVTGGTYNSGTQTLRLTKSDGNTVDVSGFAIDTDVNWYTTGATFNTSTGVITGTHQNGTWTVDIDGRYLPLDGGTITKTSTHVSQTAMNSGNAHLDLYNDWQSDTDQKGSILTFTDNYYDGSNYIKTLRAAIKGGTDTTGNTADGYLEFYTDSAGANSPNLVLRLDRNKNATFSNIVYAAGGNSGQWNLAYAWGDHGTRGYLTAHPSVSAASSSNNSGRTYIQDILLDSFGHITGITTATETVTDTNHYTTGATFNTGDGVITFTRNNGGTYTVDIDGRYQPQGSYVTYASSRIVGDASAILTTSISPWDISTASDAPTGSVDGILTTGMWDWNGWGTQSYHDFHTNTIYIRSRQNSVWQNSWATVFTTDNFTDSSSNWNTAYGWGNHASAGYLTAHPSVNAASSSNNSGRTYIQDILLDSFGHITGITTGTETVTNTDTNYYVTGATFNTGDGVITFTRNDGSTVTVDIDGRFTDNGYADAMNQHVRTSDSPTFVSTTLTSTLTAPTIQIGNASFSRSGDQNHVHFVGTALIPNTTTTSSNSSMGNSSYRWSTVYGGYGNFSNSVTANAFAKIGGTSSQFLMADGSVSTNPGWLTSHPSVSAASSSNNSGRTYIQDILLDSFGHITGITTGTETVTNTDTNYYTTGATWNGTTATLTFTRNNGGTYNVQMLETLSDVTVTGGTYNSGTQTLRLTKSDGSTVDVSGFAVDTDVNWYTTGATFNTSTGIITGTRNDGGTWTVDIDGKYSELGHTHDDRYYTESESDSRFVNVVGDTMSGTLNVNAPTGINLSDSGNNATFHQFESYWNTNAGSSIATYRFDVGTFRIWSVGTGSSVFQISSAGAVSIPGTLGVTGNFTTSGTVTASGGNSSQWNTAYGWGDHSTRGYLTSYTDTNNYTTGATFNTSNGVITFTRNDGGTYTVDIDGKYAEASHSHNYIGTVSTVSSSYDFDSLYADNQLRFHSTYANSGSWTGASITNYPTTPTATAYAYGITLSAKNTSQGSLQVYAPHNQNSQSDMFFRTGWGTDYKAWARVWTDRNDGAGSGLDADLLDGQQGSYYLNYNNFSNTPTIGNGTMSISAGGGMSGGGSFTANQTGDSTVTISHADTSSQSSTSNSGRTYIQNLSFDGYGHVTGLTTATETVTNTDTNYYASSFSWNSSNGILTLNRSGLSAITVDLDGRYAEYGHQTTTNSDFNNVRNSGIYTLDYGGQANANSPDGLAWHALFHARSGGTRQAQITIPYSQDNIYFRRAHNSTAETWYDWVKIWHESNDGAGSGLDADVLDGQQGSYYLNYNNFSNTPTIGNGTITVSAGSGLSGSGSFTVNQTGATSITISHADTSSQASSNNSGRTYIQDVLLDGYGHVTGLTTATETVTNTDTNYYTTGATFNTSDGVITGTRNDGGTWTVDIDGRYLTSYTETDTLQSVTNRGSSTTNNIYINNTNPTLFLQDTDNRSAMVHVNSNYFYILNGSANNSTSWAQQANSRWMFMGNLNTNDITFGGAGDFAGVVTATGGNSTQWNTAYGWGNHASAGYLTSYTDTNYYTTGSTFNSGTGILTFTRNDGGTYTVNIAATLTDVTVTGGTYNSSNQTLTLTKSNGSTVSVSGFAIDTDVNWYTTSASFNTGNGIITGTRNDGGTWTVDIDGRYAYTSHTHDDRYYTETESDARYPLSRGSIGTSSTPGDATGFGNNLAAGTYTRNYTGHSGQMIMSHDTGGSVGNVGIEVTYSGDMWVHTNIDSNSWGTKTIWTSRNFTSSDISNWNTAYGWGNHASAGYLTSHPTIPGASSNNSGRTYIQDVLTDSNGHVTGLTTATETVVNTDTNYYTTSASFNTSTGVITGTRNDGGTWTVDIDGRFLTSYTETDTLATVTSRGSSTTSAITIGGSLTINKSGTDSYIIFPAQTNDPGYIRHYESSNVARMLFSVSDDSGTTDYFGFGYSGDDTRFVIYSNGNVYGKGTAEFDGRIYADDGLHVRGDWVRVNGNNGIYFESHGGGWHMSDSTWIRSYGSKSVYMPNGVETAGFLRFSSNLQIYSSASSAWETVIDQNGGLWTMYATKYYDKNNSSFYLDPASSSNLGEMTLNSSGAGSTVLNVQGTSGQLFSVTDDLTGDLFAVSDASGVPIFKVNASGVVSIDSLGSLVIGGNPVLTAHPSVSAASSSNNSGRTYIQDILLDSFGHITGITTATETVVNTDTNTVTSVGISGDLSTGNITLVGAGATTVTKSGGTITITSTDTNTDTNYYTTGATFNTSNGIITGTRNDGGTWTVDIDGKYAEASHTHSYLPLAGGTMTGNINFSDTEEGITWTMNTDGAYIKFYNTGDGDTNSRLEYGTSDNGNEYHRWMIAGTEYMNLKSGGLTINGTISATGYNKSNWDAAFGWGNHAGLYLGVTDKAADSNLLDGLDSTSFVRRDTTGQFLKPYQEYGSYISDTTLPNSLVSNMGGGGLRVDFLNGASFGTWAHAITFSGYNGYNMYQLAGHYKGSGGEGPTLYVRSEPNHAQNSWSTWKKIAFSNATSFTNTTTVSFTHGIGHDNVIVQVFDSGGSLFFPSEMRVAGGIVTVNFEVPRSGRLVVVG